ncbi:hypothetical protein [Leptothoe spongobia]|uniref:Uncharacterized protein n=1 Tax=Leptothoe spongobia TAU-MAC 1115 TaxID=1967444 RepID=A0A947DDD9_9CYAN|nr:hypothetical protein [Leptothoe spongobia]MBT9314820.1 hypothetical protein [Leptothoe spongobia TAU-MAC 1115]
MMERQACRGVWGSLGPHEQEGFGEESPEQPLSLLANFQPMIFKWLVDRRTDCLGLLRVPQTPMAKTGPPVLEPSGKI